MKLNFAHVQKLLKAFDFNTLFREELGWEPHRYDLEVIVNGKNYRLQTIAHKRGFYALLLHGDIPPYAMRRKIDSQVAKSYHEHMIIFTDAAQMTQIWQWVKRERGKLAASRETRFFVDGSGEALIQKLEYLAITLAEEDELTILDVAEKVKSGFDVEKVTKRFYDRFKDEHAAFLKFVEGIPEESMQRWYVSVTLNRLMFVYFIQKKGFLDGNLDYLRHNLSKTKKGKNLFYSDFLCPLFFRGFAEKTHGPETVRLLGQVPYLNGGIFAKHQIEELHGEAIRIPDSAFERLFDFFDQYQWHLDERPLRADNEINPDVLGYIFEKYINQKQMGAYYTKEDITEYISKNTILPHLFDAARKTYKPAFEGENSIWDLLAEHPDRYIYDAMKKGVDLPLPENIATGLHDVAARGDWNKSAPDESALPTEIWREVVTRRQRYESIREQLAGQRVREVNELITLNLDIRQFAQDVIEHAESPDLLRAFWKAIRLVTVLDPTVGSGAFLFAALNILEPLYDACLERMQVFVDELDASDEKYSPEKFSDFRKALEEIKKHPNRRYFILKSIIVNNLYGVDIMDEAVEICKLRLFLKLVAQVEQVTQIEPLPDIDFNIRAGNTLVGFATRDQVFHALEQARQEPSQTRMGFADEPSVKVRQEVSQMAMLFPDDLAILNRIEQKAEDVDRLFRLFRQQQTELGGEVNPEDKAELRRRLKELDDELNIQLARQYGLQNPKEKAFSDWKESHKPFHWFAEFYGIMSEGGFDVIIGNPPYVEYRIVKGYRIPPNQYKAEDASNLYAFCMERSSVLINSDSWFGMIVPTGILGLDDTVSLREVLLNAYGSHFCSTYSIRPSKLFEGVDQRLCIYLSDRKKKPQTSQIWTTKYNHWNAEERTVLFQILYYTESFHYSRLKRIPQLGSKYARSIIARLEANNARLISNYYSVQKVGFLMHYHRSPRYWIRAMDFEQYFKSETRTRSIHHFRDLYFQDENVGTFIGALLNSSLFFFWFLAVGNGRNITGRDIELFPVGEVNEQKSNIKALFSKLMNDYKENSVIRVRSDCEYQEFHISKSKPIIDEIDKVLARHYGLSDEELDFIINYDVKYRMGAELEDEDG